MMLPGRSRAAVIPALGVLALSVALASYGADGTLANADANANGQGRDASPVVKIKAPANNSTHVWNSLVSYDVVVSYKGKSTEYQEIPASEVLVQATYVPDLAATAAKPAAAAASTPAGLLDIVDSD